MLFHVSSFERLLTFRDPPTSFPRCRPPMLHALFSTKPRLLSWISTSGIQGTETFLSECLHLTYVAKKASVVDQQDENNVPVRLVHPETSMDQIWRMQRGRGLVARKEIYEDQLNCICLSWCGFMELFSCYFWDFGWRRSVVHARERNDEDKHV